MPVKVINFIYVRIFSTRLKCCWKNVLNFISKELLEESISKKW